jgi:tellurite resistance protein TehA-like permease
MFVVPTTPLVIISLLLLFSNPSFQTLKHTYNTSVVPTTPLAIISLLLLFSNPPFQTLEHTYP